MSKAASAADDDLVQLEASEPIATARTCRECGKETAILHPYPGDTRRTVCGECQGTANRRIQDQIRDAIRELKRGTDADAERAAESTLAAHFGKEARDLVQAIADARAEGKYTETSRARSKKPW